MNVYSIEILTAPSALSLFIEPPSMGYKMSLNLMLSSTTWRIFNILLLLFLILFYVFVLFYFYYFICLISIHINRIYRALRKNIKVSSKSVYFVAKYEAQSKLKMASFVSKSSRIKNRWLSIDSVANKRQDMFASAGLTKPKSPVGHNWHHMAKARNKYF